MTSRKTKRGGSHSKDRLLVIAITVFFALGLYYHLPLMEKLEYVTYDLGVRMTFRNPGAADRIAIIAIDDRSLEQLGRWPWSRSEIAGLISQLSKAKPKVISLTLPLSDITRDPGLEHIQQIQEAVNTANFPKQVGKQINEIKRLLDRAKRDLDADGKLSRAIAAGRNIVLPMHFTLGPGKHANATAASDIVQKSRISKVTSNKTKSSPYNATKAKFPAEDFSKNASAIGNLGFLKSSDGGVRSEPLIVAYGEEYYPSLALLSAARSMNLNQRYIKAELGKNVQLGKTIINTDSKMVMYPGFLARTNGKSPFATYSFSDVVSGKVSDDSFRNKIVVLGLSISDANDKYLTPVMAQMPTPELVANMITGILNQDFYARPEWTSLTEYALFGGIFLMLLLLFPQIGLGTATFISLFVFVALIATGQYFMIGQKIWLKTAYPATFLLASYLLFSIRRLMDTDRLKQLVETDSAQSNRMLGLSFQAQGQLDMAMDKFRKLPIDDSVLELIYNLALDYERKRQFNKAVAAYNYILDYDKKFRDAAERKQRVAQAEGTIMMGVGQAAAGGTMILSGSYQRPTLGRYEIEEELGKGAMGVVYLGRDPKINRVVAIKTLALSTEFEGSELQTVKDRFFREAETAGGLSHPNIVTIYDAGEEHDLAYIAMEFLEGKDLTEYILEKKPATVEWVFNIIIQVAEALDYAHKQNVVHRDIKPANIMYNEQDNTIKVTDFGIARITASSNTKTGVVLGTPSYMSPEQLAGERVDGRSDLFSMGVMMFELLTKKQPFSGDSMAALMYQIANTKQEDITKIRKNLPACVKTIVDKLLQKDPKKRYQTGAEVVLAVQRCANKVL